MAHNLIKFGVSQTCTQTDTDTCTVARGMIRAGEELV
jgi:hypothetical protein